MLCFCQPTVKNFINGKFVESKSDQWIDIINPATNEVVSRVPQSTQEEVSPRCQYQEDNVVLGKLIIVNHWWPTHL